MTESLCKWLNLEVRLSEFIEPKNVGRDFSSGFLLGELLNFYQMQDDFSLFIRKNNAIAKLNNFKRLDTTLKMLGIPFDINIAQDLMQEKQDVAVHLLYQLYGALERVKKTKVTHTMLKIMQPPARALLHKKDHEIFSHRLHQVVKRDAYVHPKRSSQPADTDTEMDIEPKLKPIQKEIKSPSVKKIEVQEKKQIQRVVRHDESTHPKKIFKQPDIAYRKESEPKVQPIPMKTLQTPDEKKIEVKGKRRLTKKDLIVNLLQKQRPETPLEVRQKRFKKLQNIQFEIDRFEVSKGKSQTSNLSSSTSFASQCFSADSFAEPTVKPDRNYMDEVKSRLRENTDAAEDREKRLDMFLVRQFKALENHKRKKADEQLVKRLTRPTRQERHLAAQLMLIRRQKEVILDNRLFREFQYKLRKEKDLKEALYRKEVLAHQAKLAFEEEIRKELEYCERLATERAKREHREICEDILEQIVDLANKVGEYNLLTESTPIPEKQMRQWKELLIRGLPLYDVAENTKVQTTVEKQDLVDDLEYDDYINMRGEWALREDDTSASSPILPTSPNEILGHVIERLRTIAHPPVIESPLLPRFSLRACILGKLCSGKTKCLENLSAALGINVLSADMLIQKAFRDYEKADDPSPIQLVERPVEKVESDSGEVSSELTGSSTPSKDEQEIQRRIQEFRTNMAAAEKDMRDGKCFPDQMIVDILLNAIRQIPAHSGWIIDGFPCDIASAHLLEKALGGSINEWNEPENKRPSSAFPYPPTPSPPPTPMLDLALLLHISDECAIRRAYLHSSTEETGTDRTLYRGQIQHRITCFQDVWPEMKQWFGEKQKILLRLDADVEEEELCSMVESALKEVIQGKEIVFSEAVESPELKESKSEESPVTIPPTPVEHRTTPAKQDASPKTSPTSTQKKKGRGKKPSSSSPSSNETSQGARTSQLGSSPSDQNTPSFVDEPLPLEMAEILCNHWNAVCATYQNYIKKILQSMQAQQLIIHQQLFDLREQYKQFLGRPDLKQEFVSHWQKGFNSIPDDMRKDEDTKAELHLRLEELCERLSDIIEKRKEEDDNERNVFMTNDWLEDHSAVLMNHHTLIMQAELNRFQETLNTLKVYYWSMHRQGRLEQLSIFFDLPFLETSETKEQGGSETMLNKEEEKRSKSKGDLTKQDDSEIAMNAGTKLIADYNDSVKAISDWVSIEVHSNEPKLTDKLPEKEEEKPVKETVSKKEKKGSSKGKQKAPPPAPVPMAPVVEEPEISGQLLTEETSMKLGGDKLQDEYGGGLKHEEKAALVRIEQIKCHSMQMLQSLQNRARDTFSLMEVLSNERYEAEKESIEQLSEVVCRHIEAGVKIHNELLLSSREFCLNADCYLTPIVTPPPPPPCQEKQMLSTPTIVQLEFLCQQFQRIAPLGFLASSEFLELLEDMISGNLGRNTLPTSWRDINEAQLMEIMSLLMNDYEMVDWRQFLLCAAYPWPVPTLSQLLDTLQRYNDVDVNNTGYIDEEHYMATDLWFPRVLPAPCEGVCQPFNRLVNLHKFFFYLFANHRFSPPRLDYTNMLLYFAIDPYPSQGFIRALSVVVGHNLGQISLGQLAKSMPSMEDASERLSLDIFDEADDCTSTSSFPKEPVISLPALLSVICHKAPRTHTSSLSQGSLSPDEHMQKLVHMYSDLGYMPDECASLATLMTHSYFQLLLETITSYELIDIHRILMSDEEHDEEADSLPEL